MSLELDYRDAVDCRPLSPVDNTVSAIELARQHRVRYVYHTSVGDIVLRHMPLRMERAITASRLAVSERTRAEAEKLDAILGACSDLSSLPEDVRRTVYDIADTIAVLDKSYMGVIESPEIGCPDDYEDLLAMLTRDERDTLYELVREFATSTSPSQVDETEQAIAERYGLKTFDETCVGLMTTSQATYYADLIKKERRAVESQIKRASR